MSRNRYLATALLVALTVGSSAAATKLDASEPEEPIVHDAGTEIGFHRECADVERYQVWAFGALRSEGDRARALARLYARRHAVQLDEVFVGLQLVALQVDAGVAWADAPFALRMDAHSTGHRIIGTDHVDYGANPERGVGEILTFGTDVDGRADWLDFIEPAEGEKLFDRRFNHSPQMEVTATELALSDSDRRVTLALTLTHRETGDEIVLTGPAMRVPDRIWNANPPEPRVLGLFQSLNPFDEGSVWRWMAHQARYNHCVDERRHAKRWFAAEVRADAGGSEVVQAPG
ncbi:MAG: hypothetical protein F4X99_01895 [Gammaproteobacteria bacterium]|nr:hypothetical protein [Gammaproteobacteria bacterium]